MENILFTILVCNFNSETLCSAMKKKEITSRPKLELNSWERRTRFRTLSEFKVTVPNIHGFVIPSHGVNGFPTIFLNNRH